LSSSERVALDSSLPRLAGNALLFVVAKTIEVQFTDSFGLHEKGENTGEKEVLYFFSIMAHRFITGYLCADEANSLPTTIIRAAKEFDGAE
jgi:hypothetical protein